jgi:hypothetical protein
MTTKGDKQMNEPDLTKDSPTYLLDLLERFDDAAKADNDAEKASAGRELVAFTDRVGMSEAHCLHNVDANLALLLALRELLSQSTDSISNHWTLERRSFLANGANVVCTDSFAFRISTYLSVLC